MESIGWYLIEAVNVGAELLIVALYFNRLLAPAYKDRWYYMAGYFTAALVLYFIGILNGKPWVLITVTFFILLLLSMVLYQGRMVHRAFLCALFIVIVFISEIIFIGILNVLEIGMPGEVGKQGMGRLIGMIGTKIIYFWIVTIVCRVLNRKIKEVPGKQWIMIFTMPAVSTVLLYIIYSSFMASLGKYETIIYFVAVLGLLYINYAVFDFFETYLKQLRISVLEQVIERENINYRQMEAVYGEMRKMKHDVANQLEVANALIAQNNKESAEAVLKNIAGHLGRVNTVCYTGEPILDSMINMKLKCAYEIGIKVTKRIKTGRFHLDTIELCRAIGNAFDNAIEGCQRSELPEQHIYFSMQQIEEKIVIEINNSAKDVNLDNMLTDKANKSAHGIGLDSIKTSMKKLDGYVWFDCKDNIFSLKMVLPNR